MKLFEAYYRAVEGMPAGSIVTLNTNGGKIRARTVQQTLSGMVEVLTEDYRTMLFSENGTPMRVSADTSSINYVRSVVAANGLLAEVG